MCWAEHPKVGSALSSEPGQPRLAGIWLTASAPLGGGELGLWLLTDLTLVNPTEPSTPCQQVSS